MERKYPFNTEKLKYILNNKKLDTECIICAIINKDPEIQSTELYRSEYSLVTVNLYPYNAGHLMICPLRHCENLTELTDQEAFDIHKMSVKSIKIIDKELNPAGYNIGYNMGEGSGRSIAHLHLQIVPRYNNEVGFIDVLAGDRVMVVDPVEILEKLKKFFQDK